MVHFYVDLKAQSTQCHKAAPVSKFYKIVEFKKWMNINANRIINAKNALISNHCMRKLKFLCMARSRYYNIPMCLLSYLLQCGAIH
jgi:hypothetical protein